MTITSQRETTNRSMSQVTSLARTTPGVLGVLALLVVVVGLAAGVFSAVSVQRRAQALDDLAARSGPLSVAAQEIYRSLSDADATAAGAFLAGGLEPGDVRKRYEDDIAQASNALAIAVAAREPADVTAADSPLSTLSSQLPVYTGLVETARADNRQGLPLGIAYQRQASFLMSSKLLPAAQNLYKDEVAQVSSDQDRAGSFPILEILVGLVLLVVLVVAQVYVRRHTNRVFNIGLLSGTAAALISLLWVVIATFGVIGDVNDSRTQGSAQVDVLAQARITTLQARTDETLTLVARGTGQSYEDDVVKKQKPQLNQLLNNAHTQATDKDVRLAIDAAQLDATTWFTTHDKLHLADQNGDYTGAVKLAIDPSPGSARTAFDSLDKHLNDAIDRTRSAFNDRISAASGALGGTVVGVALLAVVVAVASTVGLWQRLKEYR